MKKTLRLFMVALMAMIVGNLYADEITFDATVDLGTSVERGAGTITKDGVTISNSDGVLGNGQQYRIYKNSTMTVSSSIGNITKIVITDTGGNYKADGFSVMTSGSLTDGTWTGETSEVTFTAEGHQVRATMIVVTVAGGEPSTQTATSIEFAEGFVTRCTPGKDETVALPVATVMAGETAVVDATVTWTSGNEEIAPIVDGVIKPVNGNQGSVTITASYAGNDNFKPTSKSYTLKLYKGYVTLASLVSDLNSSNEKWDKGGELASFWMGELVNDEFKPAETLVTYASGNYTYLTDGSSHMLFYGTASVFGNSEQKLKAGDKITMDYGHAQGFDAIWGTAYRYNKLPEVKVEEMIVRVASEKNNVTYTTITADQIGSYINAPITIEDAKYDSINGKNIYFHVDDIKLTIYNQFNVDATSLEAGATYKLSGMGSVYKENYQVYLVDFVKTADASVRELKVQNRFDGAIYNLRGQRITTPAKGLYICNGKKFFVK